MKSTGEVLGQDRNFSKALMKGLISQGMRIVKEGGVLFTISDRYKSETLPLAKKLLAQGFELYCTEGTAAYLRSQGIESTIEVKATSKNQYFPTIASLIEAQKIDLVINTLSASADSQRDGLLIRRMAIEKKISLIFYGEPSAEYASFYSYKDKEKLNVEKNK
jgi:carbamoyl-phosphate synthase large subunit